MLLAEGFLQSAKMPLCERPSHLQLGIPVGSRRKAPPFGVVPPLDMPTAVLAESLPLAAACRFSSRPSSGECLAITSDTIAPTAYLPQLKPLPSWLRGRGTGRRPPTVAGHEAGGRDRAFRRGRMSSLDALSTSSGYDTDEGCVVALRRSCQSATGLSRDGASPPAESSPAEAVPSAKRLKRSVQKPPIPSLPVKSPVRPRLMASVKSTKSASGSAGEAEGELRGSSAFGGRAGLPGAKAEGLVGGRAEAGGSSLKVGREPLSLSVGRDPLNLKGLGAVFRPVHSQLDVTLLSTVLPFATLS